MSFVLSSVTLPVRLSPQTPMSDFDLMRFSRDNHPLRMEREQNGDIVIMTPTGNRTGKRNMRLSRLLDEWAEHDGRGVAFDSSTGFRLPDGTVRSPDAAWVTKERWESLTEEEQEGFGPFCPDFVIELASPSDHPVDVKRKIEQVWLANGAACGWLIDSDARTVTIYRPGEEPEILFDPTSIQGEGPVRGFELVMSRLWS